MRALPLFLLVSLAFAGCSQGEGADKKEAEGPGAAGPGDAPPLHGYVFDPAVTPMAGATVRVLENNATAVTDEDGFYGFVGLPTDQFLVLVVSLEGYQSQSRQVTLPQGADVVLNFTLAPIPVQQPYAVALTNMDLFLACQATTEVSEDNQTYDCSGGQGTTRDRWDFEIDPKLAGAVIEIFWEPAQPGAESLAARLETLELGQLNVVLAEAVGTSPLRLPIAQVAAERYYIGGGIAKLTVWAQPDSDANEAGIGAAFAVQQDMQVYACLFYVAPPDPTFNFTDHSCE
jgi:hypothetical protein